MANPLNLDDIYRQLETHLKESRVIDDHVVHNITEPYDYMGNQVGEFFAEKFPTLEDYEVDLVLSPLYTPTEAQRLAYVPLMQTNSLDESQLSQLIRRLEEASLQATLENAGEQPVTIPLHPVSIERFVNRLGLEQPLDAKLYQTIQETVPSNDDQPVVMLLAKDPVWQSPDRSALLAAFLKAFAARQNFSVEKVRFFTDFVRTYRPGGLFDLDRQFESLIRSCESDLENVTTQSFHDQQLQGLYSDSERAHLKDKSVRDHYMHLMEMAQTLKEDYHHLPVVLPEYVEALKASK